MRILTAADFTGTRRLTRLAARRDRYTLPAWWAGLGLFVAGKRRSSCGTSLGTRTSCRRPVWWPPTPACA